LKRDFDLPMGDAYGDFVLGMTKRRRQRRRRKLSGCGNMQYDPEFIRHLFDYMIWADRATFEAANIADAEYYKPREISAGSIHNRLRPPDGRAEHVAQSVAGQVMVRAAGESDRASDTRECSPSAGRSCIGRCWTSSISSRRIR
jgi:hypothetical protein